MPALLPDDRHRQILEALRRNGGVRVRELAQLLDVTEETIRRDLEKLEERELLVRRRGGALPAQSVPWDPPFSQREILHQKEKEAIARQALTHLEPGDTIFLDPSTTSLNMARLMPNDEYVVLSFAYPVLSELMKKERVRIVAIGGTLDRASRSFVGPAAEEVLRSYHVNKAFHSCAAFNLERGATEANEFQAALKKIMIRNAEEKFLLADHSKFGGTSLAHFASLEDFDCIISDEGLAKELPKFQELGLCAEIAR